jgi:hypothetical protein
MQQEENQEPSSTRQLIPSTIFSACPPSLATLILIGWLDHSKDSLRLQRGDRAGLSKKSLQPPGYLQQDEPKSITTHGYDLLHTPLLTLVCDSIITTEAPSARTTVSTEK